MSLCGLALDSGMRRRRGGSLVEILVVIVVFLIGILAVIQIFPPGLSILRNTSKNTIAAQLARSEMNRVQGQHDQRPGQIGIAPSYLLPAIPSAANQARPLSDALAPPVDPVTGEGRIDSDGNLVVGGNAIGNWALFTGPNVFRGVMGESLVIPAPRPVGTLFGPVATLSFGPLLVDNSSPASSLLVLGNEFTVRRGDRQIDVPSPMTAVSGVEAYLVDGRDTITGEPFAGVDQLWISNGLVGQAWLDLSVYRNTPGGAVAQQDVRMKIALPPDSAYSQTIGNFYVLSIPAMTGLNADYRGLQLDSVRLRREFEQIPRGTSFDAGNVYQYKLLNDVFGSLLFHPGLSAIRYTTADGDRTPVRVSVDYLVRDWRIIRDEFRVPSVPNVGAGEFSYRQKLTVSSLKVLGDAGPDSRPNPGLGFAVPTPPDAALRAQDFVLMDLETGGVILGNNPGSQYNSYTVDKSRGVIAFSDVDRSFDLARGNGISAYIVLPRDNATDPWTVPTLLPDVRGRALRAMYMAKDEMSVQVFKAADQYRIGSIDAVGTLPDLCAIGVPSQGKGRADRLYFRPADFGQRVVLDEMWLSGPTMVRDREMTIQGIENVDGRALAYIEAPAEFDFSNGYAIRRVRGVSMRARALWNPEFFKLGNDPAQNYARVAQWVTGYRRSQTEGFAMGAQR